MGWIGCVRCEKFRCDFKARTFALIAQVQPILQRVSCSKKTSPNDHKHYKTKQNISLVSHGVDRVHSLRKIRTRLRGTNFALIAPFQLILHRVSCSNEMAPNAPKHYGMQKNMSLGSIGVDRVHSLRIIPI